MKYPRNLLAVFSFVLSAAAIMTACSTPSPLQPSSQNPVAQTQQGIDVGLQIYDANHPTEEVGKQKSMVVTVMSPDLSKPLKSPLTVHGKVSGLFFYEGVFPVVVQDADGNELARAQAHADGDWMTEEDVPFTAELTFKVPKNPAGKLIFEKDNPSGLPENDQSQSFAVTLE